MMIEQRIGRIDRIGQKKKGKAFNMLTINSVDLRGYEVIEEKLNNILQQLGIDKTSDILDSTIDMKKINKLYLQSLLDPSKFEFAEDKWLMEISLDSGIYYYRLDTSKGVSKMKKLIVGG